MRVLRFVSLLAIACGSSPPPTAEPPPSLVPARLTASPLRLAPGATALAPVCAEGAEEACDAVDQDCDGAIDEGCEGAPAAALTAAAAWSGPARIELSIAGPSSTSAAGECDAPSLARAALDAPAPGTYRVEVARADACGGEAPVTVSVSLAVGGETLGPFNRTLRPGERAPVLELDLSAR